MKALALALLAAAACQGSTVYSWSIGNFTYSFQTPVLGDADSIASNASLTVTQSASAGRDPDLPISLCSQAPAYGCITGIELASAPGPINDFLRGEGQIGLDVCFDFEYNACLESAASLQGIAPTLNVGAYGSYPVSLIGYPGVVSGIKIYDPPDSVPEPRSIGLLGLGIGVCLLHRKRSRFMAPLVDRFRR